jgi:hypothetical protein
MTQGTGKEVSMNVWLSLIVCLVGLVVYCISQNGKAQTLALHCFWVGLLVFLLNFGGRLAFSLR